MVGDTFPLRQWTLRFDTDAIVHCFTNPLFATEITLGSLHRNMSEQELNLFQLTSGRMAQFRARTPQIVRRNSGKARFCGIQLDDVPNHALRDPITPPFARPADAPK